MTNAKVSESNQKVMLGKSWIWMETLHSTFIPLCTKEKVLKWAPGNTSEFCVFTRVLIKIKAEPSRGDKNLCVLQSQFTPGVNADRTHSNCTQKPNLGRSKWDFWPVEKMTRLKKWHQVRSRTKSMLVVLYEICSAVLCEVSQGRPVNTRATEHAATINLTTNNTVVALASCTFFLFPTKTLFSDCICRVEFQVHGENTNLHKQW